jgi:hypothetical protein
MKLIPFIISITAVFTSASSVRVGYAYVYDVPTFSLGAVACSDGKNGLTTKGFTSFDSLPTFPRIGGASAIEGYNSTSCGSCWKLSYTRSDNTTTTIYITAIDHAGDGFNLGEGALKLLGGQEAVDAGHIQAEATLVERWYCGF